MNQKGFAKIMLMLLIIAVASIFFWPKKYELRYSYLDETGAKVLSEYKCIGFSRTQGGGEFPGDSPPSLYCLGFPYQTAINKVQVPTTSTRNGETANWETYRNDTYGFEVKYPSGWRTKLNVVSGFFKKTGFIKEANATPESLEDLMYYVGNQVFDIWFQNPKFDKKPVLGEEKYKDAPTYYQYANYNGAPLGIFVYIFENWKYNDYRKYASDIRKEITFNGLRAYRINMTPKTTEEYPEVWATEKIEVEKSGRLFLIFYAGKQYSSDFENFLSTFRFTK
jgi:hypothetical protein